MGSRHKGHTTAHWPRGGGRVGGSGNNRGQLHHDHPSYSQSDRYNQQPGSGPFRGDGMVRNNLNMRPMAGDWICADPQCANLNFARREYCNNCKRFRYAPYYAPWESDWICPDPLCGKFNFARREYCKNCCKFRYAPVRSPDNGNGDWICPDPQCGYINFARREYCNKCGTSIYAPLQMIPSPPDSPPKRFPDDLSPGKARNGNNKSHSRQAGNGPKDFRAGASRPPQHHVDRFSDHGVSGEWLEDYPKDNYRVRKKFNRPMPVDSEHRDRGRDNWNERRPPSPSPPQNGRGGGGRAVRELREGRSCTEKSTITLLFNLKIITNAPQQSSSTKKFELRQLF